MHDCIQQNDELQPENPPKNEFTEAELQLSKERASELESLFAAQSLPAGFSCDDSGWLVYQDTSSESGAPIKICSRLDIEARTRDQAYENHGRLLKFTDPDGTVHLWSMPMELLAGDGTSYREELLSKGLLIAPGQKSRTLLTMYIQSASPKKTIWCVLQTGWNRERTAFVFHNDTIKRCGSEELILQTASSLSVAQHVAGTLEDWQQLSKLCIGNSMLIFAMSLAFAPPLLHLLQMESGGVHFRGKSSTGKSTCLFAATSVWGGPEYVQQWRATANGLEGIAANHNDSLLCLDEIGQMDPQDVGKTAYMLANGVGKARADRLGNFKKPKSWRLLFLSSGEISLSDHMREANQKARAGQEVRVLDILADGMAYGCFEDIHGCENGKVFAERILELSKKYYGVAGRDFVRGILKDPESIVRDAKRIIDEMARMYLLPTSSGQVYRAFNRFALAAVAGELATAFNITGWEKNMALAAAKSCFELWLKSRGDIWPQEEQQILSQVRLFFEQHGESRFSPWRSDLSQDDKLPKTICRAGYRKSTDNGDEFYMFRESFKKELCIGYDKDLVEQVCLKHGFLMPSPEGGPTRSERLPGSKGSFRVYRFTAKVLEGDV